MERSAADLARLRKLLTAAHGEPADWRDDFPHAGLTDPLAQLIATVLSQATNDRNSSRAFAALRRIYPRWEEILAAPEAEVARAIACGGLETQKARAIRAILERLRADRGELSLAFLAGLPGAEVRSYLLSLPGVGPKTAACVQLFALGQPAFPVDTHVLRVSGRLGLIPAAAGPAKAQALLEAAAAPADCLALHLALIQHGRRLCRPRQPACAACPLREECAFYAATQ